LELLNFTGDFVSAKSKTLARRVRPVGEMVLICHDEDQEKTAGGLLLPADSKIQVLTGRIVAVPDRMKDSVDYPFDELDRVIYDTRERIPLELLSQNRYFLVEARFIYGVIEDEQGRV
jgi:co-chaperonin GroES (HSP10)